MITISVKQPWAYLLCAGIKGIENRTWKLPEKYKGQSVLIHASGNAMTWQHTLAYIQSLDNSKEILDLFIKNNFNGEWLRSLHVSAIIGSVVFTDCEINHSSVWAEKTEVDCTNPIKCGSWNTDSCQDGCINHYGLKKPIYNWVASNPILFDTPIPAKGKLSFWDFPNIKSEKDEEGKEICCCNLGIPEKQQVLSYGNGYFRCIYCGGKWYK